MPPQQPLLLRRTHRMLTDTCRVVIKTRSWSKIKETRMLTEEIITVQDRNIASVVRNIFHRDEKREKIAKSRIFGFLRKRFLASNQLTAERLVW